MKAKNNSNTIDRIFDHIFAVVSEFDLQVFQEPTGADFQQLIK